MLSAAYEALQRVMPKEEALQIVHGYVERLARTSHKQLAALQRTDDDRRSSVGVFAAKMERVEHLLYAKDAENGRNIHKTVL